MNRTRRNSATVLATASAIVLVSLLVLTAQTGSSQEKAAAALKPPRAGQDWTVESHDRTNFPLTGKTPDPRLPGMPRQPRLRRHADRLRSLPLAAASGRPLRPAPRDALLRLPHAPVLEEGRSRRSGATRSTSATGSRASTGRSTARPATAAAASRPGRRTATACHGSDYRGDGRSEPRPGRLPDDVRGVPYPASLGGRVRSPTRASPSRAGTPRWRAPNAIRTASMPERRTDCASCHLADYNATTDPNHRSAGFPTDCAECHGTSFTGWSGANFDHDFPISSGRHAVACSECHQTSDFRVFNCLGCHDQQETTSRHNGVTGFAYNSQSCYACHPRGQA